MVKHPLSRKDRRLINEQKKQERQDRAGKVRRKLARTAEQEQETQDEVVQFLADRDSTDLTGVLETAPGGEASTVRI